MKTRCSFKVIYSVFSFLCFFHPIGNTFATNIDGQQIASVRTKKGQFFFKRGGNRYLKGNLKGAISDYERAIKINSLDAISYNNICHIKIELKKYNDAFFDCNRAISINNKISMFYNTRGDLNFAIGNKKAACDDYKTSVQLNDLMRKRWIEGPDGEWCRNMS